VTKTNGQAVKRYNLVIPEELFEEVRHEAEKRGTTSVELLRKFIRLGLMAVRVQEDPASALILREGDTERELLIL
jgi:hypothetical protein